MTKLQHIAVIAVAVAVMAISLPASAQQNSRSVVTLLTETVRMADEDPRTTYWWTSPSAPAWSQTDKMLLDELEAQNIEFFTPSGQSRISKIYRRPNLSVANASTLAELMGGDRLVVGRVVYEQAGVVGPLGATHVRASVVLTMTRAGTSPDDVGQTLELTRHAYAQDAQSALKIARGRLVEAMGDTISSTVSSGPGRVGWDAGERLIALRNVSRAAALEQVKTFLTGLEGISSVQVRWASQCVIALELNPGSKDTPDTIEYAIRALGNQTFEDFALAREPRPVAEGLAEFLISEPTQTESP